MHFQKHFHSKFPSKMSDFYQPAKFHILYPKVVIFLRILFENSHSPSHFFITQRKNTGIIKFIFGNKFNSSLLLVFDIIKLIDSQYFGIG